MDELEQILSLPSTEGYTAQDRYRDFRRVFGTDEGQRVLKELLAWGALFKPKVYGKPIDPYRVMVLEGEANFARRILYTMNNEPQKKEVKSHE